MTALIILPERQPQSIDGWSLVLLTGIKPN
jgi:hypothetical protein